MMTATLDRPARFPRWMILSMYGAYPAGLLLLEARDTLPAVAAGLALVTLSFVLAWRLWRSPWWRPGNAPEAELDERERALRNRAYQRAYMILGTAALLALVYLQLAFDGDDQLRWWLPASAEQASRLFWGAFLVTVTLPAALLAWDRERFD